MLASFILILSVFTLKLVLAFVLVFVLELLPLDSKIFVGVFELKSILSFQYFESFDFFLFIIKSGSIFIVFLIDLNELYFGFEKYFSLIWKFEKLGFWLDVISLLITLSKLFSSSFDLVSSFILLLLSSVLKDNPFEELYFLSVKDCLIN